MPVGWVSMIVRVSAVMCARAQEAACAWRGHMSCAAATEGVQLSGFVLSTGHHLKPGQSREETGPLKTTTHNFSLPVRQIWGRGSYVGGGFKCRAALRFHSCSADLERMLIFAKYALKNVEFLTFFPNSFDPQSISLPISAGFPSSFHSRPRASYSKVSRAHKSLWGQLQNPAWGALPGALCVRMVPRGPRVMVWADCGDKHKRNTTGRI